jgi:uncharacterized protein with HEPN domain
MKGFHKFKFIYSDEYIAGHWDGYNITINLKCIGKNSIRIMSETNKKYSLDWINMVGIMGTIKHEYIHVGIDWAVMDDKKLFKHPWPNNQEEKIVKKMMK